MLLILLPFAILGVVVGFVSCLKSWITTAAWLSYFAALFIICEIDYRVRLAHHAVHSAVANAGIPDWLLSTVYGFVAIAFIVLLVKGSTKSQSIWTRVAFISLQFIAALVLALVFALIFGSYVGEETS